MAEKIFKTSESLAQVRNVIAEADEFLNNPKRTIENSPISEVLVGALGAGVGGAIGFAALYGLGITGLAAAGITSGLAAAGSIIGGGMVAGIGVLAAPAVVLAAGGVGIASAVKRSKLKKEKESLYNLAVEKQNAIIQALKTERNADKERIDGLTSLNILLQSAIRDLKHDLGK